jgi:hypothetical protein
MKAMIFHFLAFALVFGAAMVPRPLFCFDAAFFTPLALSASDTS